MTKNDDISKRKEINELNQELNYKIKEFMKSQDHEEMLRYLDEIKSLVTKLCKMRA